MREGERKMNRQEIIEKLKKEEWIPFCKRTKEEQEILDSIPLFNILFWIAPEAAWAWKKDSMFINGGFYRIDPNYTEPVEPEFEWVECKIEDNNGILLFKNGNTSTFLEHAFSIKGFGGFWYEECKDWNSSPFLNYGGETIWPTKVRFWRKKK